MKVSELRCMKVFPSKKLDKMSSSCQPVEVHVANKKFYDESSWWKYEKYLNIKFGRSESLFSACAGCGDCCKNILKRNIRMYMSQAEMRRVSKMCNISRTQFIEGSIKVDGINFGVVATKSNGDCIFLDKKGKCKIHTIKPLWCKLWVCEKTQRRARNELRNTKKSKK